jgi:hypothetical protein
LEEKIITLFQVYGRKLYVEFRTLDEIYFLVGEPSEIHRFGVNNNQASFKLKNGMIISRSLEPVRESVKEAREMWKYLTKADFIRKSPQEITKL